jgi:protein-tyrosine kinase
MSSRRGNNRGSSGGPRGGDDDRREVIDSRDVDEPAPTAKKAPPPSQALTVPRRGQLLVADSHLPRVAARLPVGMGSAEQIDGFREVRTRLMSMAQALGLNYFTTLVVPLTPSSGASFVARNLAAAFTLQERRMAMLVDCNLRHPTQHLALGARTEDGGLFDFLEQPHAAIDQLVRPTAIPGLHLIPAGHTPSRHREYFSSPAMRMLMSALREEACYVVLDGPPTKGSPDARILADLADLVVLVVGYGRDTSAAITQAAGMFDPSKFAGVVFNERT